MPASSGVWIARYQAEPHRCYQPSTLLNQQVGMEFPTLNAARIVAKFVQHCNELGCLKKFCYFQAAFILFLMHQYEWRTKIIPIE